MKDIKKLLRTYYYADGGEKYVQGEKWNSEHYTDNTKNERKRNRWKDLLIQMNEIRADNPEIYFSYEQRNIAKNIVYNTNYNYGRYNPERINLIIIIYIFNYLYGRDFDFNDYLSKYELNEDKVEFFIVKNVKKIQDEKDIMKEIYKMRQKRSD